MTHGVLAPQRSTFASRRTVNGSRAVTTPWVRPADWLALTTPDPTDQRMVGLHTVLQGGSNFVTVRSAVAFKVDWGDGAGWTNYAANTTAEKNLAWSDYSPGTLTSLGYRQAIVTVEAQSGNLTSLDLQQRHSSVPRAYSTGWLDVAVSLPYGTLTFGGSNVYQANVERVTVVTVAGTNFGSMFQYCYSLQTVPLLNTAAGTNFSTMFYNCFSLQSAPALNTANGTNFSGMFQNCYSLQSVPALNTANGTNFSNMFYSCYSLQSVPALNTANGTNFSGMFYGCYSLQSVPALNTANGTNFSWMFQSCPSLQSVPALNTANGTNFSSMFQNCYSLQSIGCTNIAADISVANCSLSGPALDAIYANLATASKTITVTGNYGTASDTPSIATAKGWTVVGS